MNNGFKLHLLVGHCALFPSIYQLQRGPLFPPLNILLWIQEEILSCLGTLWLDILS